MDGLGSRAPHEVEMTVSGLRGLRLGPEVPLQGPRFVAQRWQLPSLKSPKMEKYGHETERTAETKNSFWWIAAGTAGFDTLTGR